MQEPAITFSNCSGMRNVKAAFRENQTVKHAVYEVAHCAGQYQCSTNDSAVAVLFYYEFFQQEKAEDHSTKAKKCEHQFAYIGLSKLHPECHAFIFYEMQAKPMPYYLDLLAVIVMGFDIELKSLVEEYDQENDNNGVTVLHCIYFTAPKIAIDTL